LRTSTIPVFSERDNSDEPLRSAIEKAELGKAKPKEALAGPSPCHPFILSSLHPVIPPTPL